MGTISWKLKKLNSDIKEVINDYPELEVYRLKDWPYKLQGSLEIFDAEGTNRGVFEIKLWIPVKDYPNGFPVLKEISNKIPKIMDRHVYPKTGHSCVVVKQVQLIEAKKGITISDYMKKYAVPYFANQIYFEENGKWTNENYKHGAYGEFQFYSETFQSTDLDIITQGIDLVISGSKQKRNGQCYCKAGKKFKKCHRNALIEIALLGNEQLTLDKEMIIMVHEKIYNGTQE